jgi:hypothetical protein
VQSQLHSAFVARFCQDWILGYGELRSLAVRIEGAAVAGDELACRGEVMGRETTADGATLLIVDVTSACADVPCLRAQAVFSLTLAGS